MTVQGRDVIFKFDDSCNSRCCKWLSCCSTFEIEDQDAVYVTPRGEVKKFSFRRGKDRENALRALSNIETLIKQMAETQGQAQAALIAIQHQLNIDLTPANPIPLNASQVRRIEEVALPILRQPILVVAAPRPSPVSVSHSDAVVEDYFGGLPPSVPTIPRASDLRKSAKMRDLRIDQVD